MPSEFKVLQVPPPQADAGHISKLQEKLTPLGDEGWEIATVISHQWPKGASEVLLILRRDKEGGWQIVDQPGVAVDR